MSSPSTTCNRCRLEDDVETGTIPNPLVPHWRHCPVHEPVWTAFVRMQQRMMYALTLAKDDGKGKPRRPGP